jgi:hypothetical protein
VSKSNRDIAQITGSAPPIVSGTVGKNVREFRGFAHMQEFGDREYDAGRSRIRRCRQHRRRSLIIRPLEDAASRN